mmetsp:Transcript_8113/g.19017  ORF Transcript_8113/g.19017 Transcript_8113/m.19017 type:complete len:104 (-) Transcript_8113:1285-1596(-)
MPSKMARLSGRLLEEDLQPEAFITKFGLAAGSRELKLRQECVAHRTDPSATLCPQLCNELAAGKAMATWNLVFQWHRLHLAAPRMLSSRQLHCRQPAQQNAKE